jgi:hypothetical protein
MQRRLPVNYVTRSNPAPFLDKPLPVVYQPHVYELASFVAERAGARRIVDIGAGSAQKLVGLPSDLEIVCVDTAAIKELTLKNVPRAHFIEYNLENGLPHLNSDLFASSIVICADVLEHLVQPERLATDLATVSRLCPYIFISTPDRPRARGLLNWGPPENPAHTMEWSADEFVRFLCDCGFQPNFLAGYTVSNNKEFAKSTVLVIAGIETVPVTYNKLSTAAIVNVFNEVDILNCLVHHLVSQGVSVHLIDNWSTDGTFERAEALVAEGLAAKVLRFPSEPSSDYVWQSQLSHTAAYAASLDVDWIMHCDADEIRVSPWPNTSLSNAIDFVDALGYSAIDFTVLNFLFTEQESEEQSEPFSMERLKWFEWARHPAHFRQVKCWKNVGPVDLSNGVQFAGKRIYPLKFLTKHYPFRCLRQANRKLYRDRLPRTARERPERNWHYEPFRLVSEIMPWRQHELLNFDENIFNTEYLVERISGIGVDREERGSLNIRTQRLLKPTF